MSATTTTKTSVTVAAGSHGYTENDRRYSKRMSNESERKFGIQDLINEPIRSEQFHHQQIPELGPNQFSRYSLSPPQLPLPLPQQHKHHLPSMELDSYRLPTPLTPPSSIPITSPSLAPIQSYSPSNSTASTPSITSKSDDQNSYVSTTQASETTIPLLQERRDKNKIASAKYRAKKHRQNQEMSTTIAELTADNNVLIRQLEEVKAENFELKELVDKLKSKLIEVKILKRLGRGGAKLSLSPTSTADDDQETISNSNTSTTIRKNQTKRGGFSGYAKGTGSSVKGFRK